ncbi:cytochrome c [Coralloluteibacterium stylophorae]|uniref:Cytochrome c n=1 Tax=Coralloluteibacterium stylophorae TaxID=1776034 RepID=A0A8J7VVI7_9GAMM|nr:cytochrome c [Coralloluteibacterium stylophorae]MBS7455836.1 cytochrome c [Coralloluteibacterium stylophorae]
MRQFFLLALGFVIGIFAAVSLYAAWQSRQPPNVQAGSMALLSYHVGGIKAALDGGRCDRGTLQPHVASMQALAGQLGPIFAPTGDDAQFGERAVALREALAGLDADIGSGRGCAAVGEAVAAVGETCSGCHRAFR